MGSLSKLIEELRDKVNSSSSIQEAISHKKDWETKYLNDLHGKILSANVEEKRELGVKIKKLKDASFEILNEFKEFKNRERLVVKEGDYSIDNKEFCSYSFNPLSEVRRELIDLFQKLNFLIETGKETVSIEANFDDLCVSSNHPSRSDSETFYLLDGNILRPHCTVNSVDFLKRHRGEAGARCATVGFVYRKDDETARHTHQFSQLDFVWVDRGLNLGNLKWLLKYICKELFGSGQEYRFRNSYFPFTQPSLEMDMKCMCSYYGDTKNCKVCRGVGWIEILGSGILRDEIVKNAGYGDGFVGLAGGFGLERIALIKYGIKDIRNIYENNFSFLRDDS